MLLTRKTMQVFVSIVFLSIAAIAYVKGLVGALAGDQRVLAWDIWNDLRDVSNGSSVTTAH